MFDKKKRTNQFGCPLQKGGNTRKPYDTRLTSSPLFYTFMLIFFLIVF